MPTRRILLLPFPTTRIPSQETEVLQARVPRGDDFDIQSLVLESLDFSQFTVREVRAGGATLFTAERLLRNGSHFERGRRNRLLTIPRVRPGAECSVQVENEGTSRSLGGYLVGLVETDVVTCDNPTCGKYFFFSACTEFRRASFGEADWEFPVCRHCDAVVLTNPKRPDVWRIKRVRV